MKTSSKFAYGAIATACLAMLSAGAAHAATCAQLNQVLTAGKNVVTGSASVAAASGSTASYCLVNLELAPAINIRVGLPLSAEDGGTGGVQGAWNGRVENLGGGGYAGSVGSVTSATNAGYVGSSTDTGHSSAWCNAINPATGLANSQANCGSSGGGFVLDTKNTLYQSRVDEFIDTSLVDQVRWALLLTRAYYGQPAAYNYWNGCSTGGRQGMEMAQKHADLFDGILAGSPAMNWDRFIPGNLWTPITTHATLGSAGLSPAKSAAATAAAVAACDAADGVTDGLIGEPRRCNFDAHVLQCTGNPGDPSTCLTSAEADTINSIWKGPATARGGRLWGGLEPGTSFDTNLPNGNSANAINATYLQNWVHQDPTFDVLSVTPATYQDEFVASVKKFESSASTDNTDLDALKGKGAKLIHYHGLADPLIYPFTSFNYVSRVFDRYGVPQTQSFMRSFFFPGMQHCGGGNAPQPPNMFNVLVQWVEQGVAPDYVVATQPASGTQPARTQKVCKYPDQRVLAAGTDPNDQANYSCVPLTAEPQDLHDASTTVLDPLLNH